MLKAINETRDRLAQYRTVGEMFARDDLYADRKRNRDGQFTHSVLRDDQVREVALLFDIQRRIGNPLASTELEAAFSEAAFFQRPLQDSEHLLGACPFEPTEKRCAKRAPSFERFRLLSRLRALTLSEGREERPLTPAQIANAESDFGLQKSYTFKRLRERLGLPEETSFGGVARADEGRDFVGRTSNAAEGTASLRVVIMEAAGEVAWRSLQNAPEKLDTIASVITFREDIEAIRGGLTQIGLEPLVLKGLMDAVEDGRSLKAFSGAAHISAKAARAMLPHLRQGLTYDKAAAAAGYVHTDRAGPGSAEGTTMHERMVHDIKWVDAEVSNPVARKAVIETLKQVHAVIGAHGLPGAIHVELAREVGKSKEERDEIKSGIDKRNAAKDRLRDQFKETCGHEPSSAEDLLRFELWTEQGGKCPYTDSLIAPHQIAASDNSVQVDHILPWSRSGDDSFVNKTLCFASANQNKRGRTPFEWFGADAERWETYRRVIESNKAMKGRKKRNHLLKDASVLTEKFRPRNLNDTKYATRLVLDLLTRLYPESDRFTGIPRKPEEERRKRRLFSRPGPLTDRLRRAWGLQGLKKDKNDKRIADDRHHAVDALIVAVTSEGRLNHLTRLVQERENAGLPRDFGFVDPPWPGFREEALKVWGEMFVSRAERRRARGEGHKATVQSVVDSEDGPLVYERKAVDDGFTLDDVSRIKDPERNIELVEALTEWIKAGNPKDKRPVRRYGGVNKEGIQKEPERFEEIRKVSVLRNSRPAVRLSHGRSEGNAGTADRSAIVRVDIYENTDSRARSRYKFVPVYAHQTVEKLAPNRVFVLKTDYTNWPELSPSDSFLFSLNPFCFVEASFKERGANEAKSISAYYRRFDVNDGRISLSFHTSRDSKAKHLQWRLSPTTILKLRKFAVDRLGNRTEILREKRTWRGAVCT
jgi:CRISPR-associated endonuclease Csn1